MLEPMDHSFNQILNCFTDRKHGERKQIGTLSESKIPTKNQSSDLIQCEWCNEVFVNISKAIEHKFRKHRYESTNYFCSDCGKLFPLKVYSKRSPVHKQIHFNKIHCTGCIGTAQPSGA